MSKTKVILALACVNVLFGTGYPLIKNILLYLSPAQWVFVRVLSTAVILVLFTHRRLMATPLTPKDLLGLAVAALLGIVINQICFVEGLARSIPAHSSVINATIPLQTLLISWCFRKENVTRPKFLGVLCGLAGVFILLQLFNHTFNPFLNGDLITLLNATSYSLFLVFAREALMGMHTLVALTWITLMSIIGMGIYAHWDFPVSQIIHFPPKIILFMVYMIAFQSIVTYSLNLWALKQVSASTAALFIYLQPVVATTASFYMMGDVPQGHFFVSAALIFLGILLGAAEKERVS